jgi:hypothetical protein
MAEYKRWYDHDPLLMEVMELLRNFPDELTDQAAVFLSKIEAQVGKEAIDTFYNQVKHVNGNRWYDKDPVLAKAVELLRVVPQKIQRQAAQNFLDSLKSKGITTDLIKQSLD